MSESRSPDDLGLQMELAQMFVSGLRMEPKPNGENVKLMFSLQGVIPDQREREETLKCYENALREVVPIMPERLTHPFVLADDEVRKLYEEQTEEAIADAITHVRAIFEGSHRWSPRLSPVQLHTHEEAQAQPVFSGCQLNLNTSVNPTTGEGAFVIFFIALLFDRTDAGPDATLYPEDSDPQPSSYQDESGNPRN